MNYRSNLYERFVFFFMNVIGKKYIFDSICNTVVSLKPKGHFQRIEWSVLDGGGATTLSLHTPLQGTPNKKKERTKGEKKLCLILIYVPVPLILVCSQDQVQHLPACENIFFVYVFVQVLSTIPTTASLHLQL